MYISFSVLQKRQIGNPTATTFTVINSGIGILTKYLVYFEYTLETKTNISTQLQTKANREYSKRKLWSTNPRH